MKILHISDTHGFHSKIKLFIDGVDVIVHSGDASNNPNPFLNEKEMMDFILWYSSIKVDNKIYVAGNHESSVEFHLITKETFEKNGIIYLENDDITINGIKFFGSPYSKKFNNWNFMLEEEKLKMVWDMIPEDVDVLITHTPPKGVLDKIYSRGDVLNVGSATLIDKIKELKNLKAHLFGHIHTNEDLLNYGTTVKNNVLFSNASAVVDMQFNLGAMFNGNIIEI